MGNFPYVFHVKGVGISQYFFSKQVGDFPCVFSCERSGDFPGVSSMRIVGYFPMRFNDAVWVAICIFSIV